MGDNSLNVRAAYIQDQLKKSSEESSDATVKKEAPRWGQHHAGAKILASQYTFEKRIQEIVCISIASIFMFYALYRFLLVAYYRSTYDEFSWIQPITILAYSFLGILVADFLSGFLHWGFDSWGTVEMPVLGQSFIRSFREHHVDPTSITRHDFIETNGNNFTAALLVYAWIAWRMYILDAETSHEDIGNLVIWWFAALYGAFTNQIHKWSHTYFGLPRWVEVLQEAHIILPRAHHRVHHVAPHETYFCITTGWLNWPLEKLYFWPALEYLITACTGVRPRTDDLSWIQKTE